MRSTLLLVVPGLALLLLAAHLLHAGLTPAAALAVALIVLLAVPKAWAARTVQAILAVAVIEWAWTAYNLARLRADHGEPYLRLLLILGAVTLFTALAVVIFEHRALRTRFGLGRWNPDSAETAG
jgi:4-amino-4-deoxy-L-arabinose transferase-like glycosyltransferase